MKTRSTLTGVEAHRRPSTRRPSASRSILAAAGRRPAGRRPTSCGRSATSWAQILCPDDRRRLPRRSTPAATRSPRRSTRRCRRSPRSGSTSRPTPELQEDPRRDPEQPQDPGRTRPGSGPRGHNIYNAAGASSTTGPARSSPTSGSASYTSKGNKKFQPQFDVLADGWRQPGSAIKPIDYLIGIDDHTMTAATMFMDVATNFGGGFIPPRPTTSSAARPPPLGDPVLAQHPGHQGDDHERPRPRLRPDQGVRARPTRRTRRPVVSMGIGTLEVHPIDLLGAYGAIANGGVLMPRHVDPQGRSTRTATPSGRPRHEAAGGQHVVEPAGRLHHHRHPGRQHRRQVNPFWGLGDLRRQDPPAGRLQDRARRATTSTSLRTASSPRRRTRRRRRSPSVSGWATATTRRTTASSRSRRRRRCGRRSCARSAGARRSPISSQPKGIAPRDRCVHRPPSPGLHDEDVNECSCGTVPTQRDAPAGRRRSTRRAGCCGRTAAPDRR